MQLFYIFKLFYKGFKCFIDVFHNNYEFLSDLNVLYMYFKLIINMF